MSSFLQPFTGGQGSLRQAIRYDYNNKSNGKQRLKSKKQIQGGVPFSSSLLHFQACLFVPDWSQVKHSGLYPTGRLRVQLQLNFKWK